MGECETRTQEALVAALRARPRTLYRAAQRALGAKASLFSSLLERGRSEQVRAAARVDYAHMVQVRVRGRVPHVVRQEHVEGRPRDG